MTTTRLLAIRLLHVFTALWLALASIAILVGYAAVWWQHGFFALADVLPLPWNPWSVIANLVTLSPAAGAHLLAEKLARPNDPLPAQTT